MAALTILPGEAQWRSRDVRYYAGDWDAIQTVLPEFDLVPFAADQGEPANPYLRTVMRRPLSRQSDPFRSALYRTLIRSRLTGRLRRYVVRGSLTRGLAPAVCGTRLVCRSLGVDEFLHPF
jgi:hypothetical protein